MRHVNIFPETVLNQETFPPGEKMEARANEYDRSVHLTSGEHFVKVSVHGKDLPRGGVELSCKHGDVFLITRALVTGTCQFNIFTDKDRTQARSYEVSRWYEATRRTLILKSLLSLVVKGAGTGGGLAVSFEASDLRMVASLLATGRIA